MKNKLKPLTLLLAALFGGAVYGGAANAAFSADDAGTAAAQFLKTGPGARANGMGEAFTAAADDATAIYWNPAGLARLPWQEVSFTHALMFDDIRYEWASYARPTAIGTFAAGVQYLSYGDITTRDAFGTGTGSISPGDLCATLAYARNVLGLGAGVSFKYISSKIQHNASAAAVDAGAQYALSPEIDLGAALQNAGSGLKYGGKSDPLPLMVKAGAAYHPLENLALAADVVMPSDNGVYFAGGTEYTRKLGAGITAAVRGGYNTISKDLDGSGFALGLGLKYKSLDIDYAYTPLGSLGDTSRFSIGARF